MKLSVVGSGYVGTAVAAYLAEFGHSTTIPTDIRDRLDVQPGASCGGRRRKTGNAASRSCDARGIAR